MKILVLDDDLNRIRVIASFIGDSGNAITFVNTVQNAVDELNNQDFDIILLDHDLEDFTGTYGGEITGSFLTTWIPTREYLRTTQFIIHSKNTDKAVAMQNTLRNAGFMVSRAPYGSEEFRHVLQQIKYPSVDSE